MTSRLLNVRLDPERSRRAQVLRARGVSLSDVVRAAIDQRFETEHARRTSAGVDAVIDDILRRYPARADLGPRGYDVHDRRQAREAVRRTLRRSR